MCSERRLKAANIFFLYGFSLEFIDRRNCVADGKDTGGRFNANGPQ